MATFNTIIIYEINQNSLISCQNIPSPLATFRRELNILERLGKQTIKFTTPPTILECASIVGPKEAEGPLAKYFDQTLDDEFWGEKTWEKAESKIIKETVNMVIRKARYFIK